MEDRLTRDAVKLKPKTWERAGAIGTLIEWLAHSWHLSMTEQVALLGLTDEADLVASRSQMPSEASPLLLEHLAMLMDIYQALQSLLPGRDDDGSWLRRANAEPIFDGRSPMDVMLERGRLGIKDVRAYLWAQVWSV